MSQTILVTGASGKLGRQIVENLLSAGGAKVVAGTRDTAKIADLAAKGAEIRRVDFDDAGSLATAFKGVDKLLLVSTDDIDSGKRLRQHGAAVDAAKTASVGRLFYTSMVNPTADSPVAVAPVHFGTEKAIRDSGLPHNFLRAGWYQENLLLSLPTAFASGVWYSAAGDGKLAHVARADVARVAAAALLGPTPVEEAIDVVGAKAMTSAEIAAVASKVVGKPLNVVAVTDAQLVAGMTAHGVPEPMAKFIASFDANTSEGRIAVASDVVARLTGRPARSLEGFFVENRAAFD
ncbi:MAG: SDR family oxidoreductase [Hyphomicrobiales bacterium]|nr:SDR family oxidoreductase [Hyphomicrobiales bacterium]MDE2016364.1 SDR family oxidoreductase [Hyphomicrobiales bacterium]